MNLEFCNNNDHVNEDDNFVILLTEDVECDVLEDRKPDPIARLAPVHTRLVSGGKGVEWLHFWFVS